MGTVLELKRNSSGQGVSPGQPPFRLPTEPLKVPQALESQTVVDDTVWEDNLTEYGVSGSVAPEEILPDVAPLPWRQCAVVMVLASLAVYGVGFLIVAAFNHLFNYLQL